MNNQHLDKGELFTHEGAELTPGVSANLLLHPPPPISCHLASRAGAFPWDGEESPTHPPESLQRSPHSAWRAESR